MASAYYIIGVDDNGIVVGCKVAKEGELDVVMIPGDDDHRAHENYGTDALSKAEAAKDVLGAIMPDLDDGCEACGKERDNDPDFCDECLEKMKKAREENGDTN